MIGVFFEGRVAGTATPFVIGRHTHKAVPQAARPRAPATCVDYLGLLAAAHEEQAGTVSIDFSQLAMFEGDVGAGKTVAVRAAVAGLDPTRHQVIYVANPAFDTRGITSLPKVALARTNASRQAPRRHRLDQRPDDVGSQYALRWVQAVRWGYESGRAGIDRYLENKTVWAQL